MAGVENTLKVIDGAKGIGLAAAEVFADGKLSLSDLVKVWPALVGGWSIFRSAGAVMGEAADYDSTEINQIGIATFKAIKEVLEAFKK